MKRASLTLLSALAACTTAAYAQNVNLSLNVHFHNPVHQNTGGHWYLVAKTNDPEGIAGINAYITNINTAGIVYGNGGVAGNGYNTPVSDNTLRAVGAEPNGPYTVNLGGVVNVVYFQNTAAGPIVADVGQGPGTPGNISNDPLGDVFWNNSALIASGTFTFIAPAFGSYDGNASDANTFSGTIAPAYFSQDANMTTVVRLSLNAVARPGDYNSDEVVDAADYVIWRKNPSDFGGTPGGYNTWRMNFGTPLGGGGGQSDANFDGNGAVDGADLLTWQRGLGISNGSATLANGDANEDGTVNGTDLAIWRAQFGTAVGSGTSSSSSAPEPAAVIMASIGLLAGLLSRGRAVRRRPCGGEDSAPSAH